MSRVFVLSAGRAASTAFCSACKHITNFSAAHESSASLPFPERIDYPNQHIEIDNRLTWFLPHIEDKYGDNAIYVYLRRDKEKIARSYEERWHLNVSIVKAFGHGVLMKPKISMSERLDVCRSYVDYVDAAILLHLKDKNAIYVDAENLQQDFRTFFDAINAQGDIEKCIQEFSAVHNPNKTNFFTKAKRQIRRLIG